MIQICKKKEKGLKTRTLRVVIVLGHRCAGKTLVAKHLEKDGYEVVRATAGSNLRSVRVCLLRGKEKKVLLGYPQNDYDAGELLNLLKSEGIRVDVCSLEISGKLSVERQLKQHEDLMSPRELTDQARRMLKDQYSSSATIDQARMNQMLSNSFKQGNLGVGTLVEIDASRTEEETIEMVDRYFGPGFVIPEQAQVAYS